MTVEIAIREGWHVYGEPIPAGYVPLSVEITPFGGLEVGQPVWPAGRAFRVAGLEEEFSVLDGTIRGSIPVTLGIAAGGGDQQIAVAVRFQACSDTVCLPPATVRLSLAVREAPFAE